jgi:hypothetical protein
MAAVTWARLRAGGMTQRASTGPPLDGGGDSGSDFSHDRELLRNRLRAARNAGPFFRTSQGSVRRLPSATIDDRSARCAASGHGARAGTSVLAGHQTGKK